LIWHIITCEYPPQSGGVSDYTHTVAHGLAAAGDEVHVWCPALECGASSPLSSHPAPLETSGETDNQSGDESPHSKVVVHREFGRFMPSDLRVVGGMLDQFEGPRRLLVQWVPHGYGYRAMNLHFCLWLWRRARQGDILEIMVHEPYLWFWEGSWKQNGVALVHRLMTMILLRAARLVWVSIPTWELCWRPYALGRSVTFNWLPVASNIPVVDDPAGVRTTRDRYIRGDGVIVGHFGSYDKHVGNLLLNSVPALLQNGMPRAILLLGRGSELMRDELVNMQPALVDRVHATGTLAAADLSLHVSACDVMLQPYIDGVSSRRTSTMVALAHGVPVITTSGRLTEPLWAESEAVTMAPADDMSLLVEATQRLLTDVATRRHMSAAARGFYQAHFDVKHIIAKLRGAR
jgi:glycosyltransferase involved in cell wall biosynthesis